MFLSRFIRINWQGFACTEHWLRGWDLYKYVVTEQVYAENPLMRMLKR